MRALPCPFCNDYPDPVDFQKSLGVFTSSYESDMVEHIRIFHDDTTVKDIIRKLVTFMRLYSEVVMK
jgi:hypothetical protein